MRIKIILILLFMMLPGVILAEEAKIISMSGAVDVRAAREGKWASAKEKTEIGEGGAVRTGANGGAVILMPNKTKVWLKENSSLEIEQRQTLSSRLMLVFGRIKVRVPHLMRKERFEVRSPAAVCAVRGTEFTMGSTEEGKMDLQVLFGEVKLKFTVPPQKGSAEFNIPQGQGINSAESGKAVKPVLLTAKLEREALENWNPGLKADERQKELQQKENDRAQVKDFARATNNAENSVKSFLNVVKESDLEAGRTMSDVHGNVVRVDQRMVRPDNNTIQFFNLVKRPNYADFAGREFAYNGGSLPNRLDFMQMSMNFDKALPSRIDEWPSFFNSNTINPVYASFIMANRTYADEIFVIAEGYRYDAVRDELVDNIKVVAPGATATGDNDMHTIITGMLADDGTPGKAQQMLNALARLDIRDTLDGSGQSTTGGRLTYSGGTAMGTYNGAGVKTGGTTDMYWGKQMSAPGSAPASWTSSWNKSGDPRLWEYQADAYRIGNKDTNAYFWRASENYVINNGGQIQQASDFTNSSKDPFSILKNSGIEMMSYIKTDVAGGADDTSWTSANIRSDISTADKFTSTRYASGTNIDLVFIPDLMVAAVQRMLPAITKLGD
ncbi:MAG: FecR family protein [Elusimicrobiota bacterium]|nr:FecR family protein [Elusimicrobiota bacterium]